MINPEEHMNLAYKIANDFSKKYPMIEREDLEQISLLGLVKAANNFDPSMGFQFSTLGFKHCRYEILNYLRDRFGGKDRNPKYIDASSLDAVIEGTNGIRLMDSIESPEDEIADSEFMIMLKDVLSDKEFDVIYRTYFGGWSCKELTLKYGYSKNYISIIKRRAIKKLREVLSVKEKLPAPTESNSKKLKKLT